MTKREIKKATKRRATARKHRRANGQLKSKRERAGEQFMENIDPQSLLLGCLLGLAASGAFDRISAPVPQEGARS